MQEKISIDFDAVNAIPVEDILRSIGGTTTFYWYGVSKEAPMVCVTARSIEAAREAIQKCLLQTPSVFFDSVNVMGSFSDPGMIEAVRRMIKKAEVGED